MTFVDKKEENEVLTLVNTNKIIKWNLPDIS